ncbi:MAG: TIGR00266 family protein [Planctomycetes bacterium]|nr:TIGR00266 family protein [Planctomycetota bacterium]
MQFNILYKPSYAMTVLTLAPGESVRAESGCMVAHSGNFEVRTSMSANPRAGIFERFLGVFGAFARKLFGGESLFVNTYAPTGGEGQILLAPSLTGDIIHHRLEGGSLFVQGTSYLASSPELALATKWTGLKGFFSGEGFFLLRASGQGDLFINCHGAVFERNIDGSFIVDTGHIVAFEDTLNYKVRRVGGWKSTLFSGEGLVTEFSGRGKLYMQTRNLDSFVGWLRPMLP